MRRLLSRLTNVFRPRRAEAELEREVDAHLALLEDDFRQRGMSPDDAWYAARRAFGGVQQAKERHRVERSIAWVDDLLRDFRYAFRSLRRSPGFTTVAVLTLAIGIGANTAMFAVVNAVLMKPFPFADTDRLMLVHMLRQATPDNFREAVWSYPKYRAFLDVQHTFDVTALYASRQFAISGDSEPDRIYGEVVTDRYPAVLGVVPFLGRSFTGAEAHVAGAQPVVMIGHALWMRRFGGDPTALGKTLHVNLVPHTIVGVLPAGFAGLTGQAEIWVPLAVTEPVMMTAKAAHNHSYIVVARRRTTITEHDAIAAVQRNGAQVDAKFPDSERKLAWTARAVPLSDARVDADVQQASVVLLGAVGFVLLIACVNLTNLFVSRAMSRRREVAVRVAVGASRLQIARQFLLEALLLAAVSAGLAVVVAGVLLRGGALLMPDANVFFSSPITPDLGRRLGAAGLTRIGASAITIDGAAIAVTSVLAAIVALVLAVASALQNAGSRPVEAIKAGVDTSGRSVAGIGIRGALVTAQVSLALVLLTGAGLMVKTAFRLQRSDIGVDPSHVLTAQVNLPGARYDASTGTATHLQLAERMRAIPGVDAVGLGNCLPVSGGCNGTSLWHPRRGPRKGSGIDPLVGVHWASADYFPVLGMRILRGRNFTTDDRTERPKVVIVNEEAARRFWPNDNPIGQIIAVGQGGFHEGGAEVVGVVSNVHYRSIESAPEPDVFLPLTQSYRPGMRLFIRSRTDPETLAATIRNHVRTLDPNLPVAEIKTMSGQIGDAMWRARVAGWLFSAFALLGVLLTAIGIFGVMSQTVSQRTREIGVRIALGARPRNVLRLVLMRAALLAVAGIVVGVAFALVLTDLLTTLLYQVEPNDPATLGIVCVVLLAVAVLAGYLPARRAARVDPLVALRYE